ncbi:MAG: DMT family transporter [Elainellaceae cyanobacterium]
MNFRDGAMLLLLAAIWGASFLFIRVAAPILGPVVLVECRVVLAAAALWAYALATQTASSWRMKWKPYLMLGALNCAIPFLLVAIAELRLTASIAAILNATIPLFSIGVAAIARLEQLTIRRMISLWIGFAGVIILIGWSPLPLTRDVLISAGCSLLASLFYAIGGVYSKWAFKHESPLHLAIGQQVGASLLLLPLAVLNLPDQRPSVVAIFAVIALAVLSTAIAYLLYFSLIRNVGATNTLTVALLIPIFGVLWGFLFLDEPLSIGTFAGLALILSSIVWVANLRLRERIYAMLSSGLR